MIASSNAPKGHGEHESTPPTFLALEAIIVLT